MALSTDGTGPGSRADEADDRPEVEPATGWSLDRALGLLVTLLALVIGAKTLTDNSLLTHLATGDLILDRGRVPTVDPYSRTAAGAPWTVQSWLASVVYGLGYRLGGFPLIRLLHGLVAVAIAAGLWRLLRPAGRPVVRFALALVPVVVGAGLWSPRPLMFGMAAMVAVLLVVRSDLAPWLLLPVMWLWVNSHGSFPLGLVLLTAIAVGTAIDRRRLVAADLELVAWAVAGTVLGAVNPVGPRLLWFPVELLGRREALAGVVEWERPGFDSPAQLVFLLLVPLVALAARRRAGWAVLLPATGFVAAGFLAIRNMPVAAIVAVVLVAPALGRPARTGGDRPTPASRVLGRAAVAGLVVVVLAIAVTPGADLDRYPVAAIDYLDERGLVADPGIELIHREAVGNYLTHRYGPDAAVFIDDRFDFYPIALTGDHLDLVEGRDVGGILDRRAGEVVLWQAESELAGWVAASPAWDVVWTDDEWIVACRIGSPAARRCRPG